MTYPQALEYLDSFSNYEQIVRYSYPEAFSLERVERLLERLGRPERRCPTLHVAGTKGKGSTCAFAASILSAAGLRTGLYTSPHLASFRERIRVGGEPIPEEDLAEVVRRIRPFTLRQGEGRDLTYFEVTTACAFLYFAMRGVQAAVVEVGMGGRLDATNLLLPEAAAITPVSFDHTDKLGETLAQIAEEKAGILKPGRPAVIAPQHPESGRVIERTALRVGAPLHWLERETRIEGVELSRRGSRAVLQTPLRAYHLTIPLLGRHQVTNAAVAVRMVEILSQRRPDLRVTARHIEEGISRTSWPGRCQLLEGSPAVLIDGAQNAE